MDDKSPQRMEQVRAEVSSDVDENGAVVVIGHIRIRDVDTGEIVMDQRDTNKPQTVLPCDEEGDTE